MNSNLRGCIAYIVGRLISNMPSSSVYDHTLGKHILISGNVDSEHVSIHDHARGCSISGTTKDIHDHGLGYSISLNIDAPNFSGYDHGSMTQFSGSVNGRLVSVYDHKESRHFHYSI